MGQGSEGTAKLSGSNTQSFEALKNISQGTNSHLPAFSPSVLNIHVSLDSLMMAATEYVQGKSPFFTPKICIGKQMWGDLGMHISEPWNGQELDISKTSLRYGNAIDKWSTKRHPTSLKVHVKRYANFHQSHAQTSNTGQHVVLKSLGSNGTSVHHWLLCCYRLGEPLTYLPFLLLKMNL